MECCRWDLVHGSINCDVVAAPLIVCYGASTQEYTLNVFFILNAAPSIYAGIHSPYAFPYLFNTAIKFKYLMPTILH